jgi:hypothetical protein
VLFPAIINHGKAMQGYKNEDEGARSQHFVELPRCNEVVLDITDVELDELGFDVVKISTTVVGKQIGFVMSAKFDIFTCEL